MSLLALLSIVKRYINTPLNLEMLTLTLMIIVKMGRLHYFFVLESQSRVPVIQPSSPYYHNQQQTYQTISVDLDRGIFHVGEPGFIPTFYLSYVFT